MQLKREQKSWMRIFWMTRKKRRRREAGREGTMRKIKI
jgi:hypothetical protein